VVINKKFVCNIIISILYFRPSGLLRSCARVWRIFTKIFVFSVGNGEFSTRFLSGAFKEHDFPTHSTIGCLFNSFYKRFISQTSVVFRSYKFYFCCYDFGTVSYTYSLCFTAVSQHGSC